MHPRLLAVPLVLLAALSCGLPTDTCGDGIWGPTEACEPSDPRFGRFCTATCGWHICGDGVLGPGEECDWVNDADCTRECLLPGCGNGVADEGEVCLVAQSEVATGARPVDLVLVDLDGDGLLDIVTANEDATTVTVAFNAGGGVFTTTQVEVGLAPFRVVVAQLDEVGPPDLLVASRSDPAIGVVTTGDGQFVAFGTPHVHALPSAPVDVAPYYPPPALSDRTGDLFALLPGAEAVYVLRGIPRADGGPSTPSGTFHPPESYLEAADDAVRLLRWRDGSMAVVAASGDVVGYPAWSHNILASEFTVSTFSGVRDAMLAAINTDEVFDDVLLLGDDVVALFRGDLNVSGDGIQVATPGAIRLTRLQIDGVVRDDIAYTTADGVSVHLDRGWQGTGFSDTPTVSVPVGDAPGPIAAGDLDGDGFIDIAVAHPDHDKVTIIWSRP